MSIRTITRDIVEKQHTENYLSHKREMAGWYPEIKPEILPSLTLSSQEMIRKIEIK